MDGLLSNEREFLARMIQAEAGNQGELGMRAVAAVMDNRRRAPGYGGSTFRDVLLAPGQFSPANSITGYAGGEQGVDLMSLQPSETAYQVADAVMGGQYEDPTGGALNFLNPSISQPSWLSSMQNTIKIGDHLFGTAGSGEGSTGRAGGNMQPQGLLGMMSTRSAPDQEQLPFFQRPQTQDVLDRLAIGFGGMTLRPNTALMQAAQERIGARREERQTTAQLNKTLEYLRREAAENPAAAQALRYAEATGDISGALKLAQAQPEQTALMQNYDFFLQQGMTPEQALQAVRSGSVVNVMPGGDKMADTFGAAVPGILEAGSQAQRSMIELAELEKLLAASPQGAAGGLVLFASNLGLDVAGASELQAAQALINRLVPQQRQPGSGPMSDADLALFKDSLPRIINQPGGNQLIISTIRKIAEYDKARADLVAQGLQEGKSPTQLMVDVYRLADPLADVRGAFGGEAPAAGGGGAPAVRTYNPDTQRLE